MILAQSDLTSSSLPATSTSGSSMDGGLWWLLPVAVGVFLTVLLLRVTRLRPKTQLSTKDLQGSKTKPGKSRSGDLHESKDASSESDTGRARRREKGGKKKKDRKVSATTMEVGSSVDTSIAKVTPKSKKARMREEALASVALQPQTTVESTATVTAPVNPIFEPLRDVGALRRSVAATKLAATPETRPANAPETPDSPPIQPSKGKFERIVSASVTSQSTANRWPVSATQSVMVRPKTASVTQADDVTENKPKVSGIKTTVTVETPAMQAAPRQGLKSFVSKVKSGATGGSEAKSAD